MNNIDSKDRYLYIDIAKGIGILAVIGLHTDFHINTWIGWEMPLFFLISGIFANPFKGRGNFIISKINRLLVPAFFFYIPIILYNLYFYIINKGNISLYNCFEDCAIPTALWFLIALFYISLFHIAIVQFTNRRFCLLIIAVISFYVGYLLYYYKVPQLFFINTSITSFFFYLLGNIFSKDIKSLSKINKLTAAILGSIMLISSHIIYNFNNCYIFYRNNELKADPYIIVLVAVLGILGVLLISVSIEYVKPVSNILNFFGKNSLVILCTHLYYLKLIQPFHLASAITFVIVTICMVPTIYVLEYFFPKLSGYKPLFKLKHNEKIIN